MSTSVELRSIVGPLFLLIQTPAWGTGACQDWDIDYDHSEIGFTAIQADAEFDGRFEDFEMDICFSPEALEDSRFDVSIRLASVNTFNRERDEVLAGQDFFAVGQYPISRFLAEDFDSAPEATFLATGELTLRGVTVPLTVPFRFRAPLPGDAAGDLAGGVTLSRLAFGVGQGEWQDTTWVGDQVRVHFAIAIRPPSEPDRRDAAED